MHSLVDACDRRARGLMLLTGAVLIGSSAFAQSAKFSDTLPPDQRAAIGLAKLSATEIAALDAAVDAYRKSAEAAATKQAVAEYKKHDEPGVVSRALAAFKAQDTAARKQHIFAHVEGRFSGWDGHTVFQLDNGQVWRQIGSSMYYISPVKNPSVEIYPTSSGVYRLQLDEGPSVVVQRVR